jgi:hypothetical protein
MREREDELIERALQRDEHPLLGAWFVGHSYEASGPSRPLWCGRMVAAIPTSSYLVMELHDWPDRPSDAVPVRRVIAMTELRLFDFYESEELARHAFTRQVDEYRERTAATPSPTAKRESVI